MDTVTHEGDTLHHVLVLQPKDDFILEGQRHLKQPHVGQASPGTWGGTGMGSAVVLYPETDSPAFAPYSFQWEIPGKIFDTVKEDSGYFVLGGLV